MVLCGVGGRTIAEAQENISVDEFQRWLAYRRKRGTFHLGRRVERTGAQLAVMYANVHREKHREPFTIWDFMPSEEPPEMTFEQLAGIK